VVELYRRRIRTCRYADEIARSLLEHFPNSAHLYALEQVNTVGELQVDMWRQVLVELDKLQGEKECKD
jgi:GH25 family lysozyme M1 (1,4-beta-N-acetylmuramidase)